MTDHPITPPLELVEQWVDMLSSRSDQAVFTMAAQWGAEQELEAKPKPPSLKEQALEALERMDQLPTTEDKSTIRRALEALPND